MFLLAITGCKGVTISLMILNCWMGKAIQLCEQPINLDKQIGET